MVAFNHIDLRSINLLPGKTEIIYSNNYFICIENSLTTIIFLYLGAYGNITKEKHFQLMLEDGSPLP